MTQWSEQELATLERVYRGATWEGIRNAIPKRTTRAIQQMASGRDIPRGRQRPWTEPMKRRLKQLYAGATWGVLLAEFAPHTGDAIASKARELGLTRPRQGKTSRHRIVRQLRARRIARRIRQKVLAHKIGVDAHRLSNWERGQVVPRLRLFFDWVEALDAELTIVERKS